jgi:hypothetical protein
MLENRRAIRPFFRFLAGIIAVICGTMALFAFGFAVWKRDGNLLIAAGANAFIAWGAMRICFSDEQAGNNGN